MIPIATVSKSAFVSICTSACMLLSATALACPHCKEGKDAVEANATEKTCKDMGGKACHADAEKLCGKDSLKDHATLHTCLDANKDKLSKECTEHLAKMKEMKGQGNHEGMHKKQECKDHQCMHQKETPAPTK